MITEPQFEKPPKVELTFDKKWPFKVAEDFTYYTFVPDCIYEIKIKQGFLTDFASVPRIPFIFSLFGDAHGTRAAAVIHDACYRYKLFSRKESDDIFLEAMKVAGASWWRRRIMHAAVRVFGGLFGGFGGDEDPLAQRDKVNCDKLKVTVKSST